MSNYALAVRQYQKARERYRSYSQRTRPPHVAEAYESAKRRLGRARGEPNCQSPHIEHCPAKCSSCLQPCCYGVRVLTGT